MTFTDISSHEPIYSAFQDEPDFSELLVDFVTAAADRRVVLRESFDRGQLGTVRVHAHQLRGSAGGYGFDGLSDLAGRLEDACRRSEPSIDEIGTLLDGVVDYLARVRA